MAFEFINISTGLPLDGYSATDGYIIPLLGTGTSTFGSAASINFSTIINLTNYRLKINGTTTNNGLYDIVSYNSLDGTIVIRTTFVTEENIRYEVLDSTTTSCFIVINKNVVPNGNGLRVTIVNSKDAAFYDPGWINALEALEVVECDIVVPLPLQTISVIFQNALAHCKSMSSTKMRKERVLLTGAINGLTPQNVIGTQLAAVENIGILEGIQGETVSDILSGNIEDLANYSVSNAYGNTFRCVYFYPDQIVVQAGSNSVIIDGFYIAAAAAGYFVADQVLQNPLTNKTLTGFSILSNKTFSTTILEQLASAGVTTLQPVSGGGNVVWGITTSQSGFIEEQEISIVFIRDRIAKLLRSGFAGFVGTAGGPDTRTLMYTRASLLLNSLLSSGLITGSANLVVQQDSVDPRQWDISVQVQPPYPVNWVYIKIAVGTF